MHYPDGGYGVCYISALCVSLYTAAQTQTQASLYESMLISAWKAPSGRSTGWRDARPPNTPSPVLEQPTDSHGHLPAGNIHESPSLYLSGLLFYHHHTGMTVLAVCGYCDVKYARTADSMHLAPAEWFVCVSTKSAQLLCTSVSSGPQKLLTIVTTEEKGPSSSTHRSFRAPVPVRPRDPSVSTSSGLSLIFGAVVPPHTLPPRIRSPPCIKIFFPN